MKRTPLRPKKWPKWKKTKKHAWLAMLDHLWIRSAGRCERCGLKVLRSHVSPANVHHIKARGRGGKDDHENLAFLCAPHAVLRKAGSVLPHLCPQ